MAVEFHNPKDRFSLQLSATIDADDTEFAYSTGGADCPPVPYIMWMESEKIRITAQSGDHVLVCERGYDGTTASAHPAGTEVRLLDTSKYIRELQDAFAEIYTFLKRMTGGADGVLRNADPPTALKVTAQVTPDMTVNVAAGEAVINGKPVVLTASIDTDEIDISELESGEGRIDLIEVDAYGTVYVKTGTASASPTAPSPTPGRYAPARITHRFGSTCIKDTDDASNSYITDQRSYL